MCRLQIHRLVSQQPGQIVIHVWSDHVHTPSLLFRLISTLNGQIDQRDDVLVAQQLENSDFSQSCDRETLLFRVKKDLFESHFLACFQLLGPKNLAESSLANLAKRLVRLGDLRTAIVRTWLVRRNVVGRHGV